MRQKKKINGWLVKKIIIIVQYDDYTRKLNKKKTTLETTENQEHMWLIVMIAGFIKFS